MRKSGGRAGRPLSPFKGENERKHTMAYDIPNILGSLARDIEQGGTWDEVAAELVKAGWMPFKDIPYAKRLVSPYLNK